MPHARAGRKGEVLVRTRVSLVSTGTELMVLMADYPPGSTWEAMFPFPVRQGLWDVERLSSDRVPVREAPALYGRLVRDRSGVMGALLGC